MFSFTRTEVSREDYQPVVVVLTVLNFIFGGVWGGVSVDKDGTEVKY